MLYSLECNVESLTSVAEEYRFSLEDKEFILKPDADGYISSIKIIKKIKNPEKFYSELTRSRAKIQADTDVYNELISDFQYLQSSISFGGNYCKIHWESPIQEWIPENDEEKKNIKIVKAEFQRGYSISPKLLTKDNFESIIIGKNNYGAISILEAFYTDGDNFFREFKYINAFYNFYFVIEDVYGEGNTKNDLIMKSFKKSSDLKNHIKWVMEKFIKPDKKHNQNLNSYLIDMGKSDSIEDIIEFLVLTRGRLHHFSRKSSLKIGTPFNQLEYESIAYLAMGIALRTILNEILKINKSLGIAK